MLYINVFLRKRDQLDKNSEAAALAIIRDDIDCPGTWIDGRTGLEIYIIASNFISKHLYKNTGSIYKFIIHEDTRKYKT